MPRGVRIKHLFYSTKSFRSLRSSLRVCFGAPFPSFLGVNRRYFAAHTPRWKDSNPSQSKSPQELIPGIQEEILPEEDVTAKAIDRPGLGDCSISESLLMTDAIVVARELEMLNVMIGFEQANRYTMRNQKGETIGFIAEESTIAKTLLRNIAHKHRSFTATVLDAEGNVIFKIYRPFYFVKSGMEIRDSLDNVIGEIKMDWHVWRRRYDVYLHKQQFARVDTGFLGWEFEVMDREGEKMALIDRNFVGWAKEIIADAGCYAIHYGNVANELQQTDSPGHDSSAPMPLQSQLIPQPKKSETSKASISQPAESTSQLAQSDTSPSQQSPPPKPVIDNKFTLDRGTEQNVLASTSLDGRSLMLDERAICLAMAIAIDFDYFSRKSGSGGLAHMFMPYPIGPTSGGGAEEVGAEEAGAEGVEGAEDGAEGMAQEGSDAGGTSGWPEQTSDTGFDEELHDPAQDISVGESSGEGDWGQDGGAFGTDDSAWGQQTTEDTSWGDDSGGAWGQQNEDPGWGQQSDDSSWGEGDGSDIGDADEGGSVIGSLWDAFFGD